MEHYVGLDVSLKPCVIDGYGHRVWSRRRHNWALDRRVSGLCISGIIRNYSWNQPDRGAHLVNGKTSVPTLARLPFPLNALKA